MNLDAVNEIIAKDKLNVLKATGMLWQQCKQAWDEASTISLPQEYTDIDHVVVGAMGGSHLGAQLIMTALADRLTKPLLVRNAYEPDGFIGPRSLVLATSFSGNTEETLSFAALSLELGARVICICSGGALLSFAKKHGLPYYSFESTYNPSRVPRYGSGYLFMAQLALLNSLGIAKVTEEEIEKIIQTIADTVSEWAVTVPEENNEAKQLARRLHGKVVCLVSSQHLEGGAYIFKNQLNESAKQFSVSFALPELNHHLLEGLGHPTSNKETLLFCFFQSDLYYPRIKARYALTQGIIEQQGIATATFSPKTESKLEQAFELVSFTSYVALYLGILNNEDPGPNPWVDQLKTALAKL